MKIRMIMFLILCFTTVGLLLAQPEPVPVSPGENTISEALMFAFPGDILELAEGEYTETQTLMVTLDITIRGAEGATVIWNVPTTVEHGIHVKGNLHLKNIIFKTDPDTAQPDVDCIWNMYGSVTPGQEPNAEKNSIFVDHCQFIGFYRAIYGPESADNPDGKVHPMDTLYVTNSLFYGGGMYKPYRGVRAHEGQVRVGKVQDCTFWNMHSEGTKIYGHETLIEYMQLIVDHCTYHQLGLPPIAIVNGVGIYVKHVDSNDTLSNCVFGDISDFGIKASGNFTGVYVDYHVADPVIGWKSGCGVCQPYHYDLAPIIGEHCITADPKFVNPDAGDFRYKEGSLALNAADDGGPVGSRIQVWNPGTWDHTPSTGIEENTSIIPAKFNLAQNYPNPFNSMTQISYFIPKSGNVILNIYNPSGQKVRSLVNEIKDAGSYSISWNGLDDQEQHVSSGIYFYRLIYRDNIETKKMLFIK